MKRSLEARWIIIRLTSKPFPKIVILMYSEISRSEDRYSWIIQFHFKKSMDRVVTYKLLCLGKSWILIAIFFLLITWSYTTSKLVENASKFNQLNYLPSFNRWTTAVPINCNLPLFSLDIFSRFPTWKIAQKYLQERQPQTVLHLGKYIQWKM